MAKSTQSKQRRKGLSFQWNDVFVRNMVLVVGAVLIWRGVWNVLDQYFFVNNFLLSNILSILFGVFLVFLLDEEIKYDLPDHLVTPPEDKKKVHKKKKHPSKKAGQVN